jgi:hypothetical protein
MDEFSCVSSRVVTNGEVDHAGLDSSGRSEGNRISQVDLDWILQTKLVLPRGLDYRDQFLFPILNCFGGSNIC